MACGERQGRRSPFALVPAGRYSCRQPKDVAESSAGSGSLEIEKAGRDDERDGEGEGEAEAAVIK